MATQNRTAVQNAQKLEWNKEPFQTLYSNIASVGFTPFDVSIVFGELESGSPAGIKAKPLAKVILSPEEASLLSQMLQQVLKKYSETNGPLRPSGSQILSDENFKIENA